ncbi:MAG: hypothetical protein GXY79_00370 [Chloroflexi bacterium]|nr:hypothetical protein [Chloroflexota bacterium]
MKGSDRAWLRQQSRWGSVVAGLGGLLLAGGVLLQLLVRGLAWDPRLLSGLGLLLLGLGAGQLVRQASLRRDPAAARRQRLEAQDERSAGIRARAGLRAFIVSSLCTWALLRWTSFASNGQLPVLSGDTLWYALIAILLLPQLVFFCSLLVEERRG